MILVGSQALAHLTCGHPPRVPKDFDYIATHEEAKEFIAREGFPTVYPNDKGSTLICKGKGLPVELMIAWPGSSTEAIRQRFGGGDVASLNLLYLLKMSHRYLKNSPHFLKTMRDIQFMRAMGAVIEWPDILKQREKETYDYKLPSLERNKKGFFDPKEGVGYKYDHDTIHVAMAVERGVPAYTHYQRDGAQVAVDRDKWNACPDDVKLNSVLEEALVLALERSQVPYRGKIAPRRSFEMALMKVCTSITSGWWREWAWEHYDAAVELFERREAEMPYLERFDRAVADGVVKELEGAYHD